MWNRIIIIYLRKLNLLGKSMANFGRMSCRIGKKAIVDSVSDLAVPVFSLFVFPASSSHRYIIDRFTLSFHRISWAKIRERNIYMSKDWRRCGFGQTTTSNQPVIASFRREFVSGHNATLHWSLFLDDII